MIIVKKAIDIIKYTTALKQKKLSAGFVPTMGALHAGHVSLITAAKKNCDWVTCSIFVNPTQFNDPTDFEKYPVTIDQDIYLLEQAGCDLLFLPSVNEMYPKGMEQVATYELAEIDHLLEGKYRPGHFQGVCQVVDQLLKMVSPQQLYLGQKDFQQCMVIQKMAAALYPNVEIIICPTQRELDGLAMSSRNRRLSDAARLRATTIFRTLQHINKNIFHHSIEQLKKEAVQHLMDEGFKVDYVEIASANDLVPIKLWDKNELTVVLIAAFLEDVRLIDNLLISD